VVCLLGVTQILAWGSSYYLLAVLAEPIRKATGWPAGWVMGGLSLGLLVSGVVSPRVGRTVDRVGGRPVLAASAVLMGLGLLGLALAPGPELYAAAWAVLGLGMGAGLYDPAFATLGRLYGEEARSAITGVTLFGGFASTVCWPLSALLLDRVGWRGACFGYAAIQLGLALPLYLFGLPREPPLGAQVPAVGEPGPPGPGPVVFWRVAIALTLAAMVMTVVSVELLALLQARGFSLAAAVGVGALLGPSQVGARLVEFAVGRRSHPVWVMLAALILVAVGLAMLLLGPGLVVAGIVLYGAGGGIRSIARGTLPLALYGRAGYGALLGRLALPALLAQAASPTIGALLLGAFGPTGTLLTLLAAALLNVVPVLLLIPYARSPGALSA